MKTVKLGNVCDLIARGISPRYTEDGLGVIVLNQRCIRGNQIDLSFSKRHDISLKPVKEDRYIQNGDILVNSTGHGTLGRTALVKGITGDTLVDSHVTILRPKKELFEPRYFAYLISRCENDFVAMATGTSGQTELPRISLRDYEISYDESLKEQWRVVERLDAAFKNIDQAIQLTEKNIINTELLFGSFLNKAIDQSGEVETKTIGEIAGVEYGLTEKAKRTGDYRLVRITDIDNDGFLRSDDKVYVDSSEKSKKYLLNDGEIVVARTGATFGKVLYFESDENAVFASYLIRINFIENISTKLFWYFAKTPQYWSQANALAGGAAQPQFNGNALKQLLFSYPKDTREQERIIKELDEYNEKSRKVREKYEEKLNHLKALKQSLLAQEFSENDVK